MRRIIASLDIGNHTIKLVVGEIVRNKLNILACVDTPSRGIKKGFVINSECAIEALDDVFKKGEEQIGLKITKVIVSVPANDLECFLSEGYTSVNNETGLVTSSDIIRSMQSAVYNEVMEAREIVALLPTKFLLDDSIGAGVNIGASKSTVAIFNKGILTGCEVIDMGGDSIDYDLGYVYKINRKDAMYLKESIALADKTNARPSESVILENKNGDKIKVNQFDASEIVMGRLEELLNLVKKQINLLTKKEISYIIVTGGVTEMADFKNIVNYIFNDAYVGNVTEIGARHNKFATCVGLIKYYDSRLTLRNRDFSIFDIEEQEELSGIHKKVNINEDSLLGKLFGYFFDN